MKHPSTSNHSERISLTGIVERSLESLTPWPSNPRRHSQAQIEKLSAAIQSYGFTVPILVDESGVVLGGHGRLLAARHLKLSSVPARVICGLSEAEKRGYVLADNKLASLSTWDDTLLRSEIELLVQEDFAIELTGFSTAEIDLMVEPVTSRADRRSDELQESDVPTDVVTRTGDLWTLGSHRLLCGDALSADSYKELLGDERVQLSVVDYPYNVRIKDVVGKGRTQHREFAMASGEMTQPQFTTFLQRAMENIAEFSSDGALSYGFMDWKHMREILDAALPHFGDPKQLIVWTKETAGMGSHYRSQHELIFLFKKGTAPHVNNFGLGEHGRYRTNVWKYPGSQQFTDRRLLDEHPTPKPVAMIADALRDSSHRKDLVLDPFSGSGTILIAAERTGRKARAIEMEPSYCDSAVLRWQRITGKLAIHSETGRTWSEMRSDRCGAVKT